MLKFSFRRTFAAVLAAAMSLSCVVTASADGAPDSDITDWNPLNAEFTMSADGYTISGSNNEFALSDKNAKDFTIEADITMLGGEGKATFVYGAANQRNTSGWRGVELYIKDDNSAYIKAFVENGATLISDTAIAGLNRSQSVNFKIQVSGNQLTAWVNGSEYTANADDSYAGGTVGILAYNTTARFNHIRFSGSEAYEGSKIKNWYAAGDSRFVETSEYYQLYKPGGDAFLISDVGATAFEYEAKMKIVSGDRATLTYGNAEPTVSGSWHGVELQYVNDTTGKINAFLAGGDPFIKDVEVPVDWSGYTTVKISMDESRKLTVYVNGEKIGEGIDNDYTCGTLGLLSWNSMAQFADISYSLPSGEAVSQIESFNALSAMISNTSDGYLISGENDNFAISDKNALNFELSADVKPISGYKIATLTYGNESQTNSGAWHGVEFKITGESTASMKAFVVNGSNMFEHDFDNLDLSGYVKFTLRVVNQLVTVSINGETVGTYTDDTYSGGYAGLLTYASASYFNNIIYKNLSDTEIESVTVDGVVAERSDDSFSVVVDKADAHVVKAVTIDSEADVTVAEDNKSFTVTAQDGTQKTYTLNITENISEPDPVEPSDPTNPDDPSDPTDSDEPSTPSEPTNPGSTDSDDTNNTGSTTTPAVTNGTQVVNGKTVLYVNGKQVTGTQIVTISGKTYAVVGGYVKTGKKQVVKIKSLYYIVNASGVVQKSTKNKLIKVGTKSYVVNKNGVVQRKASGNKLVKVGAKSYIVNKLGVVQKGTKNKLVKIGKKAYVVNKSGVVQKNKKSIKVGKKTYKTSKKGVATLKK